MQFDSNLSTDLRAAISELVDFVGDFHGENDEFERHLMAQLTRVGRAAMRRQLEELSPSETFVEDGVYWRVAVQSNLSVMTSFGEVEVARTLFRSQRNGPTRCLVSEKAGLLAGFWTPQAAKLASLAIAEMPMARAESFFAEAGIVPASRSSLLRLGCWLHDLCEEDRVDHEHAVREATPIPENARTVTVSLDGVMVMMVDSKKAQKKAAARARGQADKGPSGWREASVGVISFYDAEGVRLATRRYGRMPEANKTTTKAWLTAELAQIQEERPDLIVVAIADGAANNWTFLETLGADHEVVDFFHTAEHLHRHVNKANGASTVDTQAKLQQMRQQLLRDEDGAGKVFAELESLQDVAGIAPPSSKKTSGKRQPTYFQRHHRRMNYARLLKENIPIGSGVTESTCKLVLCDRLRRTGMRWTKRGGQAIMTLRAHRVSETFDSAWESVMRANQSRLIG